VRAVSGRFTDAPLAVREAAAAGLAPVTPYDLQVPDVACAVAGVTSASRAAV
jgi:hypothetical protein